MTYSENVISIILITSKHARIAVKEGNNIQSIIFGHWLKNFLITINFLAC